MISNGKFIITNGETTSELYSQLGSLLRVNRGSDGRYHLSALCTADGINKWSKNKSIESVKELNITDYDRAQQFYGFDIQTIFCNNSEDTLNTALSNGADYPYIRPSNWFRLRDFDGYNPAAEIPFKYTQYTDPTTDFQWVDVYFNPKGEIRLSEIIPTEIGGNVATFRIALVYRKRGTLLLDGAFATDDNGGSVTISDVENGAQPIIRFTLPSSGTYDMVLAITDASYIDQEDTSWLYLPDALFVATYDENAVNFSFGYADDNALVGRDENGRVVSNTTTYVDSIDVLLRAETQKYLKGKVTVEIGEMDGSDFTDNATYTQEFAIGANESYDFTHTFGDISSGFPIPTADKIYVRGWLEYGETDIAETLIKKYFNFLDDKLSGSEVAPVTLKEIIDTWEW